MWPARPGWVARLKLIERITGLVFQLVSLDLRVGKHPGRNCPSALHARKSRKIVAVSPV